MSIRKRTLAIISATLVALVGALYLVAHFIVLDAFTRQEVAHARLDVQRVLSAIDDDLRALKGTTLDWATWDDTYTYIEDHNQAYFSSNLDGGSAYLSNNIDLMFFVDNSDRIIYGQKYDPLAEGLVPADKSFAQHLTGSSSLLRDATIYGGVTGILSVPQGSVLAAAAPILTSSGKGPQRGWLVFASWLDKDKVAQLARTTRYELSTYRPADPSLPPDVAAAFSQLSPASPLLVETLSESQMAGYGLVSDVNGAPAFLVKLHLPRWLYAQASATLSYLLAALIVVAIVFGLMMLWLLERELLSPVAFLRKRVGAVAASRDAGRRIEVPKGDELAALAHDINGMLAGLQASQEARLSSESKYKVLMEQASDGIAVYGFDGRIIEANDRACEMLGYTYAEMLTLNLTEIVNPDDLARTPIRYAELQKGEIVLSERTLVRKDGSRLLTEVSAKIIGDGAGIQAIVRDITERKKAEEALRSAKEFSENLINSSTVGIAAFDRDCRYTVWNPGMERMTGIMREQALGRVAFEIFPFLLNIGQDWYFRQALAGNTVVATNRPYSIPETGKEGFYESRYSPLHSAAGEVVGGLAVVNDITERKLLEEQIEHQAFHDALTGLPNRALFMAQLGQALSTHAPRAGTLAVLFLDLDDFKVINDSLGHKTGDLLLSEVGRRLQVCVRPGDMVARLGGDEFTLVLRGIQGPDDAERVAERIAIQLAAPFLLDGHGVFVTTSIGIALNSGAAQTPEDLLRDADVAMYEAKHSGKSRHAIFNTGMNERAWKRLEMEIELRRALERDEFTVYYQPVINLTTGRVEEVEALLRWVHPTRGIIAPAEFIPVAEETGLIIPIGERVLQEACRQVRDWQERELAGAPLTLSVNLSVRQLRQAELVERVSTLLEESGLQPRHLKLEITESVALDDSDATLGTLDALHAHGIKLAIDDFGTGYSALSYLKRFPVDTLKIDRTFIDTLADGKENYAIVRAVIAFAQTLSLSVTAEGIETVAQLEQLRDLGCDSGQGYLFSHPLPAADVESLLGRSLLPVRVAAFA